MTADFMSSLIINLVILIIAIGLTVKGRSLRQQKSSKGLSASSNETSTGTTFMVIGISLILVHVFQLFELLA